MSDAPELIWAWKEDHGDVWTGEWCPAEDAEFIPSGAWEMILTTASCEAFAALEPVQALIAGAYEAGAAFCHENAVGLSPRMGYILGAWEGESGSHTGMAYTSAIRDLTPSEALAALAAREAAAERRGWLAGMERAAGIVARRAQDYHDEHGIYDFSTGVTEYPGTGSESMEEWEEIADAIRAEMEKQG